MSSRGNVRSGKCLSGEISSRGSVRLENCPFGEMSIGEVSVGEVSVGELSPGKCQSGNCPVGELSAYHIFLQATFFSFTIYNQCSPRLIQSFDFQLNFAQNVQLVTFLLIVVLLFTTKNDPFLSMFHNV